MSKRAKNYQLSGLYDTDGKTPEILEQSVKRLNHAGLLTNDWFGLTNEIEKISNISSLEMTKNTEIESKLQVMGTNVSGTLWDSDKCLDSLRILVENHKVNVLLRVLKDLKEFMRSPGYMDQVGACATKIGKGVDEVLAKIDHFEFDLGLLMKRLFEHVEAVQTAELGQLTEHITSTLAGILASHYNPDHIELRQEGLVFCYVYGLFRYIEQLNEGQIIHWAIGTSLHKVLVDILVGKSDLFANPVKQRLLEALGALADCENMSEVAFTENPETKTRLVNMRKEVIRDLIVEFPERRPIIRPFLDVIDKYEREIKFPKRK